MGSKTNRSLQVKYERSKRQKRELVAAEYNKPAYCVNKGELRAEAAPLVQAFIKRNGGIARVECGVRSKAATEPKERAPRVYGERLPRRKKTAPITRSHNAMRELCGNAGDVLIRNGEVIGAA